jgi:alpha-1,2-mannosyltransferase
VRATTAAAALLAVSVAALLLGPLGHGWGFVDLAVYRQAGTGVVHGARLYDLRFPGDLAFTYPPFAGLLAAALSEGPLRPEEVLFTGASIALLVWALHSALALAHVRNRLPLALAAAAVALWLEPIWTTLRYGQIDLLITALVLYDMNRRRGFALGVATALKLTPAIFILYWALTRRTRAALTALATFAVTVAVGFVALPRDSAQFWGGAFAQPGRVGRIENAANQSLRGALARVLHSLSVGPWWAVAALAVGVLGMWLAVRAGDDGVGFCLCALTGLLISPVSWSHHWALIVPAVLILGVDAWRAGAWGRVLVLCAVLAVAFAHVIWWVPIGLHRHAELHLGPAGLLAADAYVIAGLGALLYAAWCHLSRRPAILPLDRT